MNSLIILSLTLSVLALLSASESYAESSEFIIPRDAGITGQSGNPDVAAVNVNMDALSLAREYHIM